MSKKGEPWKLEYDLTQLPEVAESLIKKYSHLKVWLFEGMLGAGKTTLIQEIGKGLKVIDDINSPTFSLVNEYKTAKGEKLYHLDLYRLKSLEEAHEIGLFELMDSGYVCFIEWASAIYFRPPFPHLQIDIHHQQFVNRILEARIYEN